MSAVKVIAGDEDFTTEMSQAADKLVVVDFMASWCGPCKRIAPFFDELSNKFSRVVFLKVDVEVCTSIAAQYSVTAMPTFIIFKTGVELARLQGAEPQALEAKVVEFATLEGEVAGVCPVEGMMEINYYRGIINLQGSECLNQDDDHPYTECLTTGSGYLASDCDEQLIISLSFCQPVKIHSLEFKAPLDCGPKTVRIFQNHPRTLDFDTAEGGVSTQDLILSPDQLGGQVVGLKFVKFQQVQNIQIFVKDNQKGEEITRLDYLSIIGSLNDSTNMKDFKRLSGKVGEGET